MPRTPPIKVYGHWCSKMKHQCTTTACRQAYLHTWQRHLNLENSIPCITEAGLCQLSKQILEGFSPALVLPLTTGKHQQYVLLSDTGLGRDIYYMIQFLAGEHKGLGDKYQRVEDWTQYYPSRVIKHSRNLSSPWSFKLWCPFNLRSRDTMMLTDWTVLSSRLGSHMA